MCINPQDNVLNRMALVPRVLETIGLDMTPNIREKFAISGRTDARLLPMLVILDHIFSTKIRHVSIGNYWFNYLCDKQKCNPIATFDKLIKIHIDNKLYGTFNLVAHAQTGFSQAKLNYLQQ